MGVEILAADIKPEQVDAIEGNNTGVPEMDSKENSNVGKGLEEATKIAPIESLSGANGETKEADLVTNSTFPKDAVDEWPAPKQIHTFHFVRYRPYEDQQLRIKIDQADKDVQRKNQARLQITTALREKRSERANVISQLKPLTTENKRYNMAMDEKRKEMEPLQAALGKFRNANNAVREKGMGLCSSEEELNNLIRSFQYRIQHESNTLTEEKQLLKDIKQLEASREKVIANATMKSQIQGTLNEKEAIQGQVKSIGTDMDEVRKERQAVRMQIEELEKQLKIVDDEISSLQQELTALDEKREKSYEALNALRKMRDEANACFYQNRSLLNSAKDLAAKKDVQGLEELCHNEVEKFMSEWSSSKAFRADYERRILSSLDSRQLSRDGRMRNPDEKPIIVEAPPPTKLEATPSKLTPNQAKEDVKLPLRQNASTNKGQGEGLVKSTEADSEGKVSITKDTGKTHETEVSGKKPSAPTEVDAAKLKEMKREEEIAKAKLAMERKKKLAEKAAAKAAIRAQKEAEKKQKEKEKKAKKKTGTSEPAPTAEETETETKTTELEEVDPKLETPAPVKSKEQKEKVRNRARPRAPEQLPRAILKRKKSYSYWKWAAPAAILALLLAIVAYFSFARV